MLVCVLMLGLCESALRWFPNGQRCLCICLTVVSRCRTHSTLVSLLDSLIVEVHCRQSVSVHTSKIFFSFVYFECVAIRRLFFLPQLTLDCSAALPVTSRSAAQFSSEPKPNRQLMDGCEVGGLCGRECDRLSN